MVYIHASTKCAFSFKIYNSDHKWNSKIPKEQTEIDRQDHGQQNETKYKHRTHNTTLKTKAGVTRTLQKTRMSSGAPEG